ncbi:MAG: hypothetical protein MJ087_01205 [Lachnospiraceae bacterium]|nr:hypothetical protein [Lachnospiraceae bacterium]
MIPFAILSGTIEYVDGEKLEIRILELENDAFTFRTNQKGEAKSIELHFWNQEMGTYEACRLISFDIQQVEESEFYQVYRVKTKDALFVERSKHLQKQYLRYIDLKLSGDDVALAHELSGYPKDLEEIYPKSFTEWREKRLKKQPDEQWIQQMQRIKEIGICLDHEVAWKKFIREGEKATHVYIGNQFCMHLFPEEADFDLILARCNKENLTPVLCLAPTAQGHLPNIKKRVRDCVEKGIVEIVVNDWGMARWISRTYEDRVKLTMGILLNKMSKDPRSKYRKETSRKTSLLAKFYQDWLCSQGFSRISLEACGYAYEIPSMDVDFYLPFYQTNTSGHCIMYAMCENGARGAQQMVEECLGYCKGQHFLYPEHMNLVGCYNSLFGYDERILWDGEYLKCMIDQGIKRLILQTL